MRKLKSWPILISSDMRAALAAQSGERAMSETIRAALRAALEVPPVGCSEIGPFLSVSMGLSDELKERIDRHRGNIPRNKFIRGALQAYLDQVREPTEKV